MSWCIGHELVQPVLRRVVAPAAQVGCEIGPGDDDRLLRAGVADRVDHRLVAGGLVAAVPLLAVG
jgi:hypothetical protein